MIYLPLTLFRGKIIISKYDQVIEIQIQTNIGYAFFLIINQQLFQTHKLSCFSEDSI